MVYMLADAPGESASPAVAIVDTTLVSSLVRSQSRKVALAGGLRCDHGHVMKFVDEHVSRGSIVRAYFAHVTAREGSRGRGGGRRGRIPDMRRRGCFLACSDIHLLALKHSHSHKGPA